MAEPFKNLINVEVARQVGHHLRRVLPEFDQALFERTPSRVWLNLSPRLVRSNSSST